MRYCFISSILLPLALCAYTNKTLQLVTSGHVSSGGTYLTKGATTATGGSSMQSASYTHYSGDAAGYILKQDMKNIEGNAFEWLGDNDADALSDLIEANLGTDLFNPDTDEDGLTDSDEHLVHGTNPLKGDSDQDGFLDPDELIAGTSPLDASSRFTANLQMIAADEIALNWFGVSDRRYIIEAAPSIEGPWAPLTPLIFHGNNASSTVQFQTSETKDVEFFRVSVE